MHERLRDLEALEHQLLVEQNDSACARRVAEIGICLVSLWREQAALRSLQADQTMPQTSH